MNLIFSIISVIPNWDLKKSSKNLLDSNTNTYTYTITHRAMYKLEAKLTKTINKLNNGEITHENRLYINGTDYGTVTFEQIESFYQLNDKKILCPIGKYEPIKLNLNDMKEIKNNIEKKSI